MDHVFAYSYGEPFVGMLRFVSLSTYSLTNLTGNYTPLAASSIGYDELHGHVPGEAV